MLLPEGRSPMARCSGSGHNGVFAAIGEPGGGQIKVAGGGSSRVDKRELDDHVVVLVARGRGEMDLKLGLPYEKNER